MKKTILKQWEVNGILMPSYKHTIIVPPFWQDKGDKQTKGILIRFNKVPNEELQILLLWSTYQLYIYNGETPNQKWGRLIVKDAIKFYTYVRVKHFQNDTT